MYSRQVVEAVYERDIDLLVLEEILSDISFSHHLLEGSEIPPPINLGDLKACHSYNDEKGEVDIRVDYILENRQITLWIENKIDAVFQKDQIKRYQQRKKNTEHESFIILLAPKDYIQSNSQFDWAVSYESLKPYFETLDLRGKYKNEVLEIAIKKLRTGYVAKGDRINYNFKKYYRDISNVFENIEIELPPTSPKGSTWVKLKHTEHPTLTIWHKINNHRIDIEIPKKEFRFYSKVIASQKALNAVVEISNGCYIRLNLDYKININEHPEKYQDLFIKTLEIINDFFSNNFLNSPN